MSQILDKLGIYDLIGVLLPGIIATSVTYIADMIFFHLDLSDYLGTNDTIFF